MKKFSSVLFALLIMTSCSQEQTKNYVTLKGKLENNKDSILTIASRQGIIKKIEVDKTGAFKDTLKLNTDKGEIYNLIMSQTKAAPIFLKNGFDLTLKGNADEFLTSFEYSGNGASNNNFIKAQIKKNQSIGNLEPILALEEIDFNKKIDQLKKEYDSIINSYKDLDSTLYAGISQQNDQMIGYFKSLYERNKIMGKGKPSPTFANYVDIKGGTKSLSDFKGKYVYVDVWATWCGPCIQQIPFLKDIKKEYKNKNIVFVGISTDDPRKSGGSWEAAEQKWRTFVKERDLGDVQLWSGQDYSFQQAYQISGIPRFILIDPNGNIVEAEAPRPSDPALKDLLNSLEL